MIFKKVKRSIQLSDKDRVSCGNNDVVRTHARKILLSFLLNRNIDVFTWKVIVGMVATAAGVFLISY